MYSILNLGSTYKLHTSFGYKRVCRWRFDKSHVYYPQVMSSCPLPGGGRGENVLKLLKALSPILQPSLVEMWDTVIPKLMQHLEGEQAAVKFCWITPSPFPGLPPLLQHLPPPLKHSPLLSVKHPPPLHLQAPFSIINCLQKYAQGKVFKALMLTSF